MVSATQRSAQYKLEQLLYHQAILCVVQAKYVEDTLSKQDTIQMYRIAENFRGSNLQFSWLIYEPRNLDLRLYTDVMIVRIREI